MTYERGLGVRFQFLFAKRNLSEIQSKTAGRLVTRSIVVEMAECTCRMPRNSDNSSTIIKFKWLSIAAVIYPQECIS